MTSALVPVPVVVAQRGPRLLWLPAALFAAEGVALGAWLVAMAGGAWLVVGGFYAAFLLVASGLTALRRPVAYAVAVAVGGLLAGAAPVVLALTDWTAGAVLGSAVLAALPFSLLLAPAVAVWRRDPGPHHELPWPEGWRRQQAAGITRIVAPVVVVAFVVADAVIEGRAGSVGAAMAVFGCGLLFAGLSVASLPRRDGVAAPLAVTEGTREVGGVGFAASARYPAGMLLGTAGLGVLFAGLAVLAHGPLRLVAGGLAAATAVAITILGASRNNAAPRLLLAPDVVVIVAGTASWTVPWSAVVEVVAFDQSTFGPAGSVHVPFIGLVVDPPEATRIGNGRGGRMKPPARRSGVDVVLPARSLDADPVLVFWALRFYAANPFARRELADGRALHRLHGRDLRTPPVPG